MMTRRTFLSFLGLAPLAATAALKRKDPLPLPPSHPEKWTVTIGKPIHYIQVQRETFVPYASPLTPPKQLLEDWHHGRPVIEVSQQWVDSMNRYFPAPQDRESLIKSFYG